MVDEKCLIGPIRVPTPSLVDDGEFNPNKAVSINGKMINISKFEDYESFTVHADNYTIWQLLGLNYWDEVFWIDSATDLVDNIHFRHSGWYYIVVKNFKRKNEYEAQVDIDAYLISRNPNEFFNMNYNVLQQVPYDYPEEGTPTFLESYYGLTLSGNTFSIDATINSVEKYPSYAYGTASYGGSVAWKWAAALYSSGTAQATCSAGSCAITNRLIGTNYRFNIPTTSTVLGCQVTTRYANNTPTGSSCNKVHAMNVIAGTSSSLKNNIAYTAGTNTSSLQTWTLGGASDLWTTLSSDPNQWNNNVQTQYYATVAPVNGSTKYTSFVDYMKVKLWYQNKEGYYTRFEPALSNKTAWGYLQTTETLPAGTSATWYFYRASDGYYYGSATGTNINISSLEHVDLKMVCDLKASGTSAPSVSVTAVTQTGSA